MALKAGDEGKAVGSGPSATPDATLRAREQTVHKHPIKSPGCKSGTWRPGPWGNPVPVTSDWVTGGLLVA